MLVLTSPLPSPSLAEAHAGDATEDEAADAGPVTSPLPHAVLAPTPEPQTGLASRPRIRWDLGLAWTQAQSGP